MKDSLIRESRKQEVELYYERREGHDGSRRVCWRLFYTSHTRINIAVTGLPVAASIAAA
jgi:hypothetical protein